MRQLRRGCVMPTSYLHLARAQQRHGCTLLLQYGQRVMLVTGIAGGTGNRGRRCKRILSVIIQITDFRFSPKLLATDIPIAPNTSQSDAIHRCRNWLPPSRAAATVGYFLLPPLDPPTKLVPNLNIMSYRSDTICCATYEYTQDSRTIPLRYSISVI